MSNDAKSQADLRTAGALCAKCHREAAIISTRDGFFVQCQCGQVGRTAARRTTAGFLWSQQQKQIRGETSNEQP